MAENTQKCSALSLHLTLGLEGSQWVIKEFPCLLCLSH